MRDSSLEIKEIKLLAQEKEKQSEVECNCRSHIV